MSMLTTYIANMMYEKGRALADFGIARTAFYNLGVRIEAEDWSSCKSACDTIGNYLGFAYEHSFSDAWGAYGYIYDLRDALSWIDTNWPTGATVDMAAILSAMVTADKEQLTYFIGLVDAYRSAIWDQPFNASFFAALASGFRQ